MYQRKNILVFFCSVSHEIKEIKKHIKPTCIIFIKKKEILYKSMKKVLLDYY